MDITTLIGLCAATLTTISFLPQVLKTWQSKSAKDISLGMFLCFALGVTLWLIYGILIKDFPIIIANSITIILVSIILFFKFKYS